MQDLLKYLTQRLYLIANFIVLLAAYYFIFVQPFFPNQNGNLGHDYQLYFPRMLMGVYYFTTNGLSVIPWFTPSCCGGTVLFAHPQSLFFSIPQFLNFYFLFPKSNFPILPPPAVDALVYPCDIRILIKKRYDILKRKALAVLKT